MSEKQLKYECNTWGFLKDTDTGELIRGSRVGDLINKYVEENEELKNENKELQETLLSVLKQLYSAQRGLVYDYSTDIANDEKELAEYFKEKYGKYGWRE